MNKNEQTVISKFGIICTLIIGFLLVAANCSNTAPNGQEPFSFLIDDFEGTVPLSQWSFNTSNGVNGTFTNADGHVGEGGKLTYDFTGSTSSLRYVSITHDLSNPVAASAISFWVKALPGIMIKLNIYDRTGQRLQYPLTRPFNQTDAELWYQYVVELDDTPEHWGGADDGVFHEEVHTISIHAVGLKGYVSSGEVSIDDIEALTQTSFILDPSTIESTPVADEMATLASRIGVNIHFPIWPSYELDECALDLAQEAGITWIRMDLSWADIYKGDGIYDFSFHDGTSRKRT